MAGEVREIGGVSVGEGALLLFVYSSLPMHSPHDQP